MIDFGWLAIIAGGPGAVASGLVTFVLIEMKYIRRDLDDARKDIKAMKK